MKPKYFYKPENKSSISPGCEMLYATYEDVSYYAEYPQNKIGGWMQSSLTTSSFINDPDYAPVAWKDIKAAYPYHKSHRLTPTNSIVKEQQQTEVAGTEPAT